MYDSMLSILYTAINNTNVIYFIVNSIPDKHRDTLFVYLQTIQQLNTDKASEQQVHVNWYYPTTPDAGQLLGKIWTSRAAGLRGHMQSIFTKFCGTRQRVWMQQQHARCQRPSSHVNTIRSKRAHSMHRSNPANKHNIFTIHTKYIDNMHNDQGHFPRYCHT